jgi:hypothetical protein
MRKLFLSLLILGCSIPVKAEIIDKPSDICKVAQSGRKGSWLDDAALKKCLNALQLSESLQIEQINLEKQIDSYYRENNLLKQQLSDTENRVSQIFEQNKDLQTYADKVESDLKKWYHNPFIVGTLGICAGIMVSATAVVAIKK